ncbi:MAG: patatin-like phospholipase family protein [Bacteroidales bacterium]|nr:patatin-like phospholipase family protein [Bacteroidales bacterium]
MHTSDKQYKIGLALSGGGARGFAHIGVLMALEKFNITPNIVSGVSAGAIVGALYCDGYTPDEIVSLFKGEHFKNFARFSFHKVSLFQTQEFQSFMRRKLKAISFDKLNTPLKIIVTNLDRGISETINDGEIASAVVASSSLPVIFPPIVINGHNYVDGGVLRNFPVIPIRKECEFVIGVNVNPLKLGEYKKNILTIAERCYSMMYRSNSNEDSRMCDLLIEPYEAVDYSIFDLNHIDQIISFGYNEAMKKLDEYDKKGLLPNKNID